MLAISNEAEEAIKGILDSEGIPEGAAFRISSPEGGSTDGEGGLAVSILESAPPEDQVVEGEDVEVCLEPVVADMLDDKQLDASVSDGQVQFSLSEQEAV